MAAIRPMITALLDIICPNVRTMIGEDNYMAACLRISSKNEKNDPFKAVFHWHFGFLVLVFLEMGTLIP